MHRLLKRQLKKLDLDIEHAPDIERWRSVLQQIDASYSASDQDRYTLERSLTISSEEMQELYRRQKETYEKRLQSVFNAMPDVLFLMTEDGQCIDVMSGNKRLLEQNRSMALGKYINDVFTDKEASQFDNAIQKALSSEQLVVLHYELEIDGKLHYFEGRIMASKYEDKGRRTVVFIAIDITKTIKADNQGRLLSTVFDSSEEGMLILDNKLQLVSVNHAFCELTGQSIDDIEKDNSALVQQFIDIDIDGEFRKQIRSDGHWVGEISAERSDGVISPMWLSINTVFDNRGRLINYVIMLTDISEIKRSQEELEHVATHDSLTNLPNRFLFNDRLQQAVNRAKRNGDTGALFFLDLDRFKNVNDNLGHQVGDELLINVTQRLLAICRSSDTLARLGGDEFTLIVEGLSNTDEINPIAEKIQHAFKEPFELGGYNLDINASIGISVFPDDSSDTIELLKHADTAMYSAKKLGRNTYQFYTQELTTNAFEYFALEIAMKRAIEDDELFLLYQPQLCLSSGNIIGVEALLRWRHPEHGIVSPDKFIAIAESTGQIEEIGEWVIAEACRQCSAWDRQGLSDFIISINLSRKQLIIPDLHERVHEILNLTGIAGDRLEFEITESSILDNEEIVYHNLKKFREMGISMSIDDFGTGYSSLVNLKQFPLSRLKIDQSYIRDVTHDANDEAIIRAIIALGKSLQLDVIAEGVEEEKQRNFLMEEGCDQVQGYLFGKPILPEDITELMIGKKVAQN